MKSLVESILGSNSAKLNWISKDHKEFKLSAVYFCKMHSFMSFMDVTVNDLKSIFDFKSVLKYPKDKYLRTDETTNVSERFSDFMGLFNNLGNIIYNMPPDGDIVTKRLKDAGCIKDDITVEVEEKKYIKMIQYSYRFKHNDRHYLEMVFTTN